MTPLNEPRQITPGDTTLRCVAIPVVAADIGANLQEVFALWSDDRFCPVIEPLTPRPHLLVMVNNASATELARASEIFDAYPGLHRSFSGFSAISADLRGDKDLYAKDLQSKGGAFGARAGPNFLFMKTMQEAAQYGGFTLQTELDCLPVQAGWIESTQAVISGHASAWVIGSVYAGIGELYPDTQSHLNGNALYRTGDPRFQAFLSNTWMPRLLLHSATHRNIAYDCWWALERAVASALEANDAWFLFQEFDSFFHNDPFIVNLLVTEQGAQDYNRVFDKFTQLGHPPVFFHGQVMNALRALLLEHAGDSILDGVNRLSGALRVVGAGPGLQISPPPKAVSRQDDAPTDGEDWLDRLARRTETEADIAASRFLRILAAQVLLAPDALRPRLVPSAPLSLAAARARKTLGSSHDVVRYFDLVRTRVTNV